MKDDAKFKKKRRAEFIRAVAEYLVADQAKMSILLEMGSAEAKRWAAVRAPLTPSLGWATVEEAEAALTKFIS